MRQDQRRSNIQRINHSATQVKITVGEFVLHSNVPVERYAISDAFEKELERLLSSTNINSFLHQETRKTSLDAGRVSIPRQVSPASIGRQAAQAVFKSLLAGSKEG
jgi:hypothetical protein